jgi:hypothetical protein
MEKSSFKRSRRVLFRGSHKEVLEKDAYEVILKKDVSCQNGKKNTKYRLYNISRLLL